MIVDFTQERQEVASNCSMQNSSEQTVKPMDEFNSKAQVLLRRTVIARDAGLSCRSCFDDPGICISTFWSLGKVMPIVRG